MRAQSRGLHAVSARTRTKGGKKRPLTCKMRSNMIMAGELRFVAALVAYVCCLCMSMTRSGALRTIALLDMHF